MMTELTERQRAILAAADAVRDAYKRTTGLNRYDVSREASDAYTALVQAERVLKSAACLSEPTTTNPQTDTDGDAGA